MDVSVPHIICPHFPLLGSCLVNLIHMASLDSTLWRVCVAFLLPAAGIIHVRTVRLVKCGQGRLSHTTDILHGPVRSPSPILPIQKWRLQVRHCVHLLQTVKGIFRCRCGNLPSSSSLIFPSIACHCNVEIFVILIVLSSAQMLLNGRLPARSY